MDLTSIPHPYRHDPGRKLSEEEKAAAVARGEITRPEDIKPHCVIERDNNGYRSHRRYGRLNER